MQYQKQGILAVLTKESIQKFFKNNEYTFVQELPNDNFYRAFVAYSQKLGINVEIKIYHNDLNTQYMLQILEQVKNKKYTQQLIEVIKDELMGLTIFVFELCDSNLSIILEDNQLNIKQIYALTYQLLSGLIGLQHNKIIHGNLKPWNILYSISKNQFLISDLEIGGLLDDVNSGKHELVGNQMHMSPEVLYKKKPFTHKVKQVFYE
ncbi:hypothetical protein ABPG73_007759 [Tetrahymena malaccensis]